MSTQGQLFGPHSGVWHAAPGSRSGRERRWTGKRWEYRDPPGAERPPVRPIVQSVDYYYQGPLEIGMTAEEAEEAIRNEPIEHFAVLHEGRVVCRVAGEARHCVIPDELRRHLSANQMTGYGYTHNHPSGAFFSLPDMHLAMMAGIREFRASIPTGGVWVCTLNSGHWPEVRGARSEMAALLRVTNSSMMDEAFSRMNRLVRAAGGDPQDGENAKGFTYEAWRKITGEEGIKAFQRLFNQEGIDATFRHEGPEEIDTTLAKGETPGGHPVSGRAASRVQASGGSGGQGRVLAKAARPPGGGWEPIPGGKRGGYRRRKGKSYEYWYADRDGSGGYTGPLKEGMTLAQVEQAARSQKLENGAFLANGKAVWVGGNTDPDTLTIPGSDIEAFKKQNLVFTHNHPQPLPLSAGDLSLAFELNLKEIRAVFPDGKVCVLKRKGRSWKAPNPFTPKGRTIMRDMENAQVIAARRAVERLKADGHKFKAPKVLGDIPEQFRGKAAGYINEELAKLYKMAFDHYGISGELSYE